MKKIHVNVSPKLCHILGKYFFFLFSVLVLLKMTFLKNILVRKFRSCSGEVKDQLFKTYLANLYCGQLWSNFNVSSLIKLKVAYNNVFRFLNNIKRGSSISGIFAARNIHGFSAIHRNVINGFSNRIFSSSNELIQCICQSIFFTYSSQLSHSFYKTVHW